ncbi:MAG TPA: ARMT1-like domain-containing protein [Sedimentisphaerales bacterium]|nr:ARMT1-like domain-containing protein [Sedimentisphaerales bacterium]
MRTYFDCVPCSVRQVLDAVRMITDDEAMHERVLRELLGMWQRMDMRQSPPAMAQQIHRFLRQFTGVPDPYVEVKNRYNEFALGLYPELKERVENSPDPFETAVRLSIAGNIIDFGVNSNVEQGMVYETILRSLTEPLDRDALQGLRQAVDWAKDILFLGDNTGEIVLDRLLVERMPRERLTYVVRGAPILNDALMADAQVAGLTDLVEVIDNGSDAPGTILETCSDAFRKRFEQADLVVAKGQGNFESMDDTPKNIFFLLKPKCAVLARHLNCQLGRLLILRSDEAGACVP